MEEMSEQSRKNVTWGCEGEVRKHIGGKEPLDGDKVNVEEMRWR